MRSSFAFSALVVAASLAMGGCQTTAGEKRKTETVMRAPAQSASVQTAQAAPGVATGSNFAAAVAALAGAPGSGVIPASPVAANAYAGGSAQPVPPVYARQQVPRYAPQAAIAPLPAQPTSPVYAQRMQSAPASLPQPSVNQLQMQIPAAAPTPEPVRVRRF